MDDNRVVDNFSNIRDLSPAKVARLLSEDLFPSAVPSLDGVRVRMFPVEAAAEVT